eukprot:jgi/Ulvmu1/10124/UM006_0077.1
MRSPGKEQPARFAESLQQRYKKAMVGLVFMAVVTIALSALPIVMKEMDASAVPLRKVLSYESNIVLMESSIGLGNSFSKPSCSKQPTLRHVIVLARNGATTSKKWFSHEGPYSWGPQLMPGALTRTGLYQSFLLGRTFRERYGDALGLDEPNTGAPTPRNASLSAPRARSPPERITVNCHPASAAVDSGLGIALGMFADDATAGAAAAAAASAAAGRGMPDLLLDCNCRTDGELIGSVGCAAACLRLPTSTDLPPIPSINVRAEQIHSVSQHRVCAGWRDWLWQLYSADAWHVASELGFEEAKDAMYRLLGGEHVVLRAAPEGECIGCLAGKPRDWNWLLLERHVWASLVAHEADGLQYAEGFSNAELLAALQPAAEHAWKAHFEGDQGRHHSGIFLHEILGILESAEATAQYCHRSAGTRDRCPDRHARMSLFSGPIDSLLAPLSLLGPLDSLPLPDFASHIAIELWEVLDEAPDSCTRGIDPAASLHSQKMPNDDSTSDGNTAAAQQPGESSVAPSAALVRPQLQFEVRLTYDGTLVDTSTACPGGVCALDDFLEGLEAKTTTECKVEANADESVPTWDLDESCCAEVDAL